MKQTSILTGRVARVLVAGLTLVLAVAVSAAPSKKNAEDMAKVRQSVSQLFDGAQVSSIDLSPLPGFYEVIVGPNLYYVTSDGKYLFEGILYDIDKHADLTSPKEEKVAMEMIEQVGEENMVVFSPEEYQYTVTIFTDIDCGVCRKLHSEIKQYNDRGIKVRYLMYPRAGLGSQSFKKAANVWCAKDRKTAMTLAKAGKAIADEQCENPVAQQFQLGRQLGVKGTPAIFLENGMLVFGYMPANRLLTVLKEKVAK